MQHVNDDMDNLMRKAGIDYPLFTGSADWSRVAQAMEIVEAPPVAKNKPWKNLGLLFLFLLPWLITQIDISQNSGELNHSVMSIHEEAAPVSISENNSALLPADGTPAGMNEVSPHLENTEPVYTERNSRRRDGLGIASLQTNNSLASATSENTSTHVIAPVETPLNPVANSNYGSAQAKLPLIARTENLSIPENLPDAIREEPEKINDQPANEKIATVKVRPRKKLYAGITGGINLTTIKMQEVKETGFDYGLLLGYKITKNISLEAALLSSRKYYYSDGKYLDNPKIYLPPNSKINTVEGDCRMIEIPVVVKYDLAHKKRGSWFATAGVSSFLMKKEDYAYDYYYFNTGTSHIYRKTYEKASENWLAVMQVSAGYSRELKSFQVRLEPFVQLPLKGAGYGKLPLTSAGLRLGITRSIF